MSKEEVERLDDAGMAAWANHDADAWAAVFADEFVLTDWSMPEVVRDLDGARAVLKTWTTAFPDMKVTQLKRVVGDDSVAGEVAFDAVNSGPMMMAGKEIPPTGKSVHGRGAYIARIRNGKVVEFNSFPDIAGMMMQLGFMPAM